MQGLERLHSHLQAYTRVALDTGIFLYHLVGHPRYLPLTTAILAGIEAGRWQGVTSVITLFELGTHPRRLGRSEVVRHYEILLTSFPNLEIVPVDRTVVRLAGQLYTAYAMSFINALHVGTALAYGAGTFITTDHRLTALQDRITIIVLEDFVSDNGAGEKAFEHTT